LVLSLFYGPRLVARGWRLRNLAEWVDARGVYGAVERFEGHAAPRLRREFASAEQRRGVTTDVGPGRLRLDVLTEVGLVLAIDGHAPKRSHCERVQTTSDRLHGIEQGAKRPLAVNERVELGDLARHDPTWRWLLPGAPWLLPVAAAARFLFGSVGMAAVVLLTLIAFTLVVVVDLAAVLRRRRQVHAAQRVATVLGGVNSGGEQVEVLLPGKLLWTVGGRPAPDRLRERSRALSTSLGDKHAPTTF